MRAATPSWNRIAKSAETVIVWTMGKYEISFKEPSGWTSKAEDEIDDNGIEIVSLSSTCGKVSVEVSVSDMPADESAEDQAFANYVEAIGLPEEGEDSEGVSPIIPFTFNGKKAYGFASYDQDDNIVRFFTQEPRRGMLVYYYLCAPTIEELNAAQDMVERNVRVK